MKPLVSIDVFDTAIFRKVVKPTDIFDLVEENVGHNFKTQRLLAQDKARRKSIFYDIVDIYRQLSLSLSPKAEIKEELLNCKANPYILDLYNKQEADYIFISDMYLPSKVIAEMLEICGYKNPEVYVSCELKACKGDGKLFTKVEELLGRKIQKHIGDNYVSDIMGAQRVKIPEVEYVGPSIDVKEVITPVLKSVKLRKLLVDKELSDASIEEKIGYIFAPLILSFTRSVLEEVPDDKTVYFNARDGFIMYLVARWILKTNKRIKYCRFSRKSCYLANIVTNLNLNHPSNSASLYFFKIQRIQTLRDLIKTFELDEDLDYSSVLKSHNITLDTNIEFHPNKRYIIEKTFMAIQSDLYKKVREEKKNFFKYLNKLGMKNGDFFVDLGYAGTIQGIIKRMSGLNLKGRYINTFDLEGNFQGALFEKKSFLPLGFLRPYGGAAIELIFSEARGTVVKYDEEGNPVLSNDFKYRREVTRALLRGVIKGVKDLIKEDISINIEDCMEILKRYYEKPTLEESQFANQAIFENGSYDNNESVVWFNKDWIRKGKLKECYGRSYWKAAFKKLLENDEDYKALIKYIK